MADERETKNDPDAMLEKAERNMGCDCLCGPVLGPGPGKVPIGKPSQWSKKAPMAGTHMLNFGAIYNDRKGR